MHFSPDTRLLCCDWGTSSFRLAVFSQAEGIVAEQQQAYGCAKIAKDFAPSERSAAYRSKLVEVLPTFSSYFPENQETVPVLCSGMLTSSIGWHELPYAVLPFSLDGAAAIVEEIATLTLKNDSRSYPIICISGLAAAADVLRGEETQVLGIFANQKYRAFAEQGTVILPGTHSKHIYLRANEIVGFQTYMSGELYALIAEHSILAHSLTDASNDIQSLSAKQWQDEHCKAWFRRGVEEAQEVSCTGVLFRIRAHALLHSLRPQEAKAYLSGILIGAEVGDIAEQTPLLLAAAELSPQYALALEVLAKEYLEIPADELAIATCAGQLRCAIDAVAQYFSDA